MKSIRGHRTAQIFTNSQGYDQFYRMKRKGDANAALMSFIQDTGIPEIVVSDGADETIQGEFERICRKYQIKQEQTVPYSPWSNLAEASVRELNSGMRRAMRRTGSPKRTWCYCGKWIAAIRRLTALDLPQLEGRVAEEQVLGFTPDISSYAQFDCINMCTTGTRRTVSRKTRGWLVVG